MEDESSSVYENEYESWECMKLLLRWMEKMQSSKLFVYKLLFYHNNVDMRKFHEADTYDGILEEQSLNIYKTGDKVHMTQPPAGLLSS